MKKKKSKTIKDGTILQTRDEYLYSGRNYSGKPGYQNKGLYRPVAKVAENKQGEFGVVKIGHFGKGINLTDKQDSKGNKAKFFPDVETKNNKGNYLKLNRNITPRKPAQFLSEADLRQIQQTCFVSSKRSLENRNRVRIMKGRKPKKRK